MGIDDIRALVGPEMSSVDEMIQAQLRSDVVLINQVGHYIVNSGGKRLRPEALAVTIEGEEAGRCKPMVGKDKTEPVRVVIRQVLVQLLDKLSIVAPVLVQPKNGGISGGPRPVDGKFHPVLNRPTLWQGGQCRGYVFL